MWIKKNISVRDVLVVVGLYALFLLTRLINLEKLPIFSDEGIYINWAHTAWKDASLRFISLTDGRQPLQTWGTIPFLKLFPQDKVLAARLFAVSAGFYALTGVIVSGWTLFTKRVGMIAGLLYVVTPYFVFYDRIALVDSFVNGSTIWMFFLSVYMARTLRLDIAMILGGVTGFALLGKSSVRLYAGLMLFAGIFVLYERHQGHVLELFTRLKSLVIGSENRVMKVLSFVFLYGVVMGIALLIYNVQRLSQFMHYVEMKNTTFVLTLPELIQNPFAYFPHNIQNIPTYIFMETGYLLPILALAGLWMMWKKDKLMSMYFSVWILVATFALAFVAKVLFPRYVLSIGGLLLLPAGYYLAHITSKKILGSIVILYVLISGYMISVFLFNPVKLPFPEVDRGQYLEGWTAGYGVEEIVTYAREHSEGKRVIFIAQGDFGMSGDVLRAYIHDGEDMFVRAYWPLTDVQLIENQKELETSKVFVVYGHCKEPAYIGDVLNDDKCYTFEDSKPLREIQRYVKPGNKAAIYLFELLPSQNEL